MFLSHALYCRVPPSQGLQVTVAWGHGWRAPKRALAEASNLLGYKEYTSYSILIIIGKLMGVGRDNILHLEVEEMFHLCLHDLTIYFLILCLQFPSSRFNKWVQVWNEVEFLFDVVSLETHLPGAWQYFEQFSWADLCIHVLHDGLVSATFCLSVRPSVHPSVCLSLDNNSYLKKYFS